MNSSELSHSLRCAGARSLLFVPSDRQALYEKALKSGPDAIILDLEDAVADQHKPAGRACIADAWPVLKSSGMPVLVRINSPSTVEGKQDLELLSALAGLAAVVVPKAESAETLRAVHDMAKVSTLPLIETAAGYAALDAIASAPGVVRLAIGHIDFMADTGISCGRDEVELAPLRFAVAMATRVHRLASAVDGVTVQVDDEARLRADALRALRFGFGGKLCIHPRQVAALHEALAPTADELAWARRVVQGHAAAGGAAFRLDGRMVDLPVVLQARQTLARAGADVMGS